MDDQRTDRESGFPTHRELQMDKKYFDGGLFQILPMVLAIMLAAPLGSILLQRLGVESTVLSQIIAGSVCGAAVGIAAWLVMVVIDQALGKK
jgi:hypothetical protein